MREQRIGHSLTGQFRFHLFGPAAPAVSLLLCLVLLYACASAPPGLVQPPRTDYLTASWYGPKFHGRTTASGERYDMYAMTCAHKEYPFGTKLRVTYLKTKKSAEVVVNDRGPFIRGRDLDLSFAAAKKIGLVTEGVGKVKVQFLGRDSRYVRTAGSPASGVSGPYTVQVGSFAEKRNAEHLKRGLKVRFKNTYISTARVNGRTYYRVRVGTFRKMQNAYDFAMSLAGEGYQTLITGK